MRYCSSDRLTAGMVLAKPLYSNNNKLLLGAGNHQPPDVKRKYEANEIYRYAEIVAVADTYVNLITAAWYKKAMTPYAALSRIIHAMSDTLNRPISRKLCDVIVPYPTGAAIRIIHCSQLD